MFLRPLRSITKGTRKDTLFFSLESLRDFQGFQDAFILIKSIHLLHQPDLLNGKSLTSTGLLLSGTEVFL